MQPDLLSWTPPEPQGSTYEKARDGKRLTEQAKRVFQVMKFGEWKTLSQISHITHDPEASVSARIRDLRKAGYRVDRRHVDKGLHEYRLVINQGEKAA